MKKNRQLFFLWDVTFFLVVLIVFPLVQTVNAAEIFVPADYTTIQGAINASSTGDTIFVAAGNYENIQLVPGPNGRTNITLISLNGPESTIIDGSGSTGSVVTIAGGFEATLDGFTITNGTTSENGGGILIGADASVTINNCIISNNEASYGGGISCGQSSALEITNSIIQNNSATGGTADDNGGGIHGAPYSTLIITNCNIRNNTSNRNGAGIAINSADAATITNCTFSNNMADVDGGAMSLINSAATTITDSTFSNNTVANNGGAITFSGSSPTISNSTFNYNGADASGGAISFHDNSEPTITNCSFSGNEAAVNGGAMSFINSAATTITDSTFSNNTVANNGGAITFSGSSPTISNSTFSDNEAASNGGAITSGNNSFPTISNSTFNNNTAALSGGAISLLDSAPKITNCSFSNNRAVTNPGGALSCNVTTPETTVTNSIFWGDSPAEIACDADIISVTYSNIQGGPNWPVNIEMTREKADRWPGTGNINADPRFLDQANGDFHLTNDSPCIDAGDNSDPDLQATDIDGDDRRIDDPAVADTGNGPPPIVDMGAFEKYLDVESPPPIEGGNEWTPPEQDVNVGGGGGGGEPSGIGAPPGGIFGDIFKSSVIGYHLDGWTAEGVEIYMPVTQGIKALKGTQEYVRSFAPNLAGRVRDFFDFFERKADADKEGLLYNLGTHVFPVLGKFAEGCLRLFGQEDYMNDAYVSTTIGVEEFKKLKSEGRAISPKIVKEVVNLKKEESLLSLVY